MSDPPLPSYRATNGFLAVCTTYSAFLLFLCWAFVARSWTQSGLLGWLPDKEWTTIVPAYLMTLVLFTYASYLAMMAYRTPAFDSLVLLVDSRSEVPPRRNTSRKKEQHTIPLRAHTSWSSPPPALGLGTGNNTSACSVLKEEFVLEKAENLDVDAEEEGPYDVPLSVVNALRFPPRIRPRPRHLA